MQAPPEPSDEADGSETLLVIDDDPAVLDVSRRMLEWAGYRVLTAPCGSEGLERLRQAPEVRAVLLDVSMPGLPAPETLRRIRSLRPDVKVLVMSGHDRDDLTGRFVSDRPDGFISKPFALDALRDRLAEALAD